MFSSLANFYFLENNPAPVAYVPRSRVTHLDERSWLALGLVLGAHLAVFTTLRPPPQSLPLKAISEPIMVSLLSAPQAILQKPTAPATPIQKAKKPVKKPVKTPISKPVTPLIKQASQRVTPPVQQISLPAAKTSSPIAEQDTKSTNNMPVLNVVKGAADTLAYQSPSFNAAYLHNPAPDYPLLSRRLGEQGLVLLRVQVTEDGTAGSVVVQTSSGSSRLDQAAQEAVKKWRFVSAKRGEQPVSASVVVPVRFSIEG
ncbi:MAG: energy transducer TonB [Gammaproteobacteria bacterium]